MGNTVENSVMPTADQTLNTIAPEAGPSPFRRVFPNPSTHPATSGTGPLSPLPSSASGATPMGFPSGGQSLSARVAKRAAARQDRARPALGAASKSPNNQAPAPPSVDGHATAARQAEARAEEARQAAQADKAARAAREAAETKRYEARRLATQRMAEAERSTGPGEQSDTAPVATQPPARELTPANPSSQPHTSAQSPAPSQVANTPPPPQWSDENESEFQREAEALATTNDYRDYADTVRQYMRDGGMSAVLEVREIARRHSEIVGADSPDDARRLEAMVERLAAEEVTRAIPGADLSAVVAGDDHHSRDDLSRAGRFVPPMDAATQGAMATARDAFQEEDARAANHAAAEPHFAALEDATGIRVTRAAGENASIDFGNGVQLTGIPPHEAGRLAAKMAEDPGVADAMRAFAEGTADPVALEDRLAELYALPDGGASARRASREGRATLTPELRAERDRLETLYLAETLRRDGAAPEDIRAALVAGYGPDPDADVKFLTEFVLNIAPGTGTAMAIVDTGVALNELRAAARDGDVDGMKAAGLGTLLGMAGLIPGVKGARAAAARTALNNGGLGARVRGSVLDAVSRRRFTESGTWGSRMEIAAAERQFARGGQDVVSARTMMSDEAWDALDKATRNSLGGSFSQIKGGVGEDVASRLLTRADFTRRTRSGDNRYFVWRKNLGKESLRLHDDVTEEHAQSILGLAVRPVRSADGRTTNWEFKVDNAYKKPQQVVNDELVVDPRSLERSGLVAGPDNPDVAQVRDMRILTTQFPEGELLARMEEGLRGKYDAGLVDQVLEGLRVYDSSSRRSDSGVTAMGIGEVMVIVVSALERSQNNK